MAVKVAGVWRTTSPTQVKVGGVWKATQSGWVRLSGVWREFVANTLSLGYSSTAFTIGSANETKSPTVAGGYTSQSKTFALVSGALPTGVTLNASSGVLTGPYSWNFPATKASGPGGNSVTSIVATRTSGVFDGGVIVSGSFNTNSVTFGSTTLTLAGTNTLFVAKLSSAGTWLWAVASTGTGSVSGSVLAATDDGGAIVGFTFTTASIALGGTTISIAGTRTLGVGKVNSSGSFVWAVGNGGTGTISSLTLRFVATNDGGVAFTGWFQTNSLIFGSTTLPVSSGTRTLFFAKVSSSGSWAWALANGGTGTAPSAGNNPPHLVATSDGGVAAGGSFAVGFLVFGSITVSLAPGGSSVFVVKINSSGSFVWATGNTGAGNVSTSPPFFVGTADGQFVISGIFQTNSITFGSTTLARSAGTNNWFAAKIDASGAWVWAVTNTGSGNFGVGLSVSMPDGGVIFSPAFATNSVTFGSTTLALAGTSTQALLKISSSGSFVWAIANTGTGTVNNQSIALANDGGVALCGTFSTNSVTFGASTVSIASGTTLFIAKASSSGSWLWALAVTGAGTTTSSNINLLATPSGFRVASGFNGASITFGSTTLSSTNGGITSACVASATNAGAWGSTSQASLGFPSTVTISATDSSGTATTTPTLTAV